MRSLLVVVCLVAIASTVAVEALAQGLMLSFRSRRRGTTTGRATSSE